MIQFILGVTSSILAAVIIYLFRFNLGFIVNLIAFRIFPVVAGEYNLYSVRYADKSDNDENIDEKDGTGLTAQSSDDEILKYLKSQNRNAFTKMKLKQYANRLSGELTTTENGETIRKISLFGKVTASRVIILNFESILKDHHDFGSYLFTIPPLIKTMRGNFNCLCNRCGGAAYGYFIAEKVK